MAENKQNLKKQRETVPLDAGGIDHLSTLTAEALAQAQVSRKDVLRLRLAMEDILTLWLSRSTPGAACSFRCGTRLGQMYLQISVPGQRIDPAEAEESSSLLYSNLLAQAGLSPVYTYESGENRLSLYPPRRRISPLLLLVLSIALAVGCGFACLALPKPALEAVGGVVEPLFSALMGLLQTLATPMIFLSVCWGIVCIGDVQVLGRIGRTVITRFLGGVFLTASVTALCLVWVFQPENGVSAVGGDAAAQIYRMLLGIIPGNLLSPFLEGNSLQIIFLAFCLGLTLLVLGEKVSMLRSFVSQVNTTVQLMMEVMSRYIPVFTFISLFSLVLSNTASGLGGVVKGVLLGVAACVVWPLLYALAASLRLKVSYPLLIRKLLPTYLISLATASSAAALSTNLETCQRRLGIPDRISSFAVPLGQVVFKTGGAVGFFVLAMGLAEYYNIAMPLSWVITGVLVSGMLAIATPPVPGGSLTCYTVLLTQLGIPEEAIALAIAGNVILDFFMTSCGISCLQSELALAANRLGMLDTACLREEHTA